MNRTTHKDIAIRVHEAYRTNSMAEDKKYRAMARCEFGDRFGNGSSETLAELAALEAVKGLIDAELDGLEVLKADDRAQQLTSSTAAGISKDIVRKLVRIDRSN